MPGITLEQFLAVPISIAAFLLLLTLIVFIHEYGHFIVARLVGVRVEIFSIGFGKPIARWRDRQGTEWRIAMIPLGGYVKFFGDMNAASQADPSLTADGDDPASEPHPATTQFPKPSDAAEVGRALSPEEKKVCFHFKPLWARAAVVAAGPFANFVLAVAIFWVLLMAVGATVVEPVVGQVVEQSAAEEAGFMPGDRIVAVNGRPIERFDELSVITSLSAGDAMRLEVIRNGERLELVATPRRQEKSDAFGNKVNAGVLGIVADGKAQKFVTYGPAAAFREAVAEVGRVLGGTLKFLGRLILGKEDTSQLGGPIKMAKYAGQAVTTPFDESRYEGGAQPDFLAKLRASLAFFFNLAAVISISIGFLNLLPVPVLDGGHLVYYAYEAVAGRPLGARAQAFGFRVGIVLLASLMLFVTWNDINNLFNQ
ncbi:MAG: RIP metalloprotease [Pseudomonadota bacterium]|nr:RIP metalloprotease [Pseudomonadota bacterium]